MADDVLLNAGTGGDTVAADEIAGVKFQRVKLIEGADGVNDGDISAANPLPVEIPAFALTQGASAAGALGPIVQGVVSDAPLSVIDGKIAPLSMTNEGRLRVSAVPAATEMDFFPEIVFVDELDYTRSPWSVW